MSDSFEHRSRLVPVFLYKLEKIGGDHPLTFRKSYRYNGIIIPTEMRDSYAIVSEAL